MKRSVLVQRLPLLMFILCVLQPCLDVLSYWLDATGAGNALTTLLRFAMLAAIVMLGFVLSDKKGYYFALAGILALLTAGHMAACFADGYNAMVDDLANMLRIYQLPMFTLAFITVIRKNAACMQAVRKGFLWGLLIIAAVEIISVVTHTNPYSYPNKEVGILGWFYFANSQSAILSTIVPVAIAWAVERHEGKWLPVLAVTAVGMGTLYFLATRLAYAALVGTGLVLAAALVILSKTQGVKHTAALIVVLACTAAAVAGYTVSPMSENARLVEQNRLLKMADIEEKIASDEAKAIAEGLEGTALQEARLRSAYEEYLPGVTGYFGLSRTAARYQYSEDVDTIADMRLQRLRFNEMLMEDSSPLTFWFGLEREDITHDGITYDVENDFHGIFYLCGSVGLVLMIAFIGFFLVRIALALLRDFKGVFTLEAAGCGAALICSIAHAYFTAGVLRRPNATFYLAVVLAVAWGLTQKHEKNEVVS